MTDKNDIRSQLFDKCTELVTSTSILDELEKAIHKRGFAGNADIPKLVYLVFITGMLPRPVSLVIKGPSGAGKSYSLNAAKEFIPPSAYEQFEGMSEKALVYLKGLKLKNRHLVIGEASGMADGDGRTLLRQLLSEGRVRYATVQSTSDGLKGQELPTLEGPTGLIMTTTATSLHPEDESRMLSVNIVESPEQIEAALMIQALGITQKPEPIDAGLWHNFFEYVRTGPKDIIIPFAGKIAKRLPKTHDRIKRDFPQILSLIRAHALLHSCNREHVPKGILATEADYSAIRELVNEPISQGLAVAVPDAIRRVVEGVQHLHDPDLPFGGGVSLTMLSKHLDRDLSAVSRSVSKTVEQGYLRNDNPGQGREAQLVLGERPLPSGSVLPPAEELFAKREEVAAPAAV